MKLIIFEILMAGVDRLHEVSFPGHHAQCTLCLQKNAMPIFCNDFISCWPILKMILLL